MSDSSAAPVQAPITVAELIRASVAVRTEREATNNIGPATIQMDELMESLVQEVGEAAFANLARDLTRWIPPSPPPSHGSPFIPGTYGPPLSPPSWARPMPPGSFSEFGRFGRWDAATRHQLYVAGVEYEQEKYTAQCKDSVPNYEPHPAYSRFLELATNMNPLGDFFESFFEDDLPESGVMPHPWDQDPDALEYKGFYTVLEDLLEHGPALGFERSHSLHPNDPARFPFTAQELMDAGVAMEAEMQAHDCTTISPNYTPHPAFDKLLEMCDQLTDQHTSPHAFVDHNLRREGLLQWLSLESVYLCTSRAELLRRPLFPEDDYDDTTLSLTEASDLVATFEQLEIASIPAEDMECSICYLRFDEDSPNFDNSPIKTPCCRQIFGKGCYMEVLGSDARCPMCRRHIRELKHVPAPDMTDSVTESEIALPDDWR